ncbi:zygote arrest protein 1-like [Physella acuta]|uniref:zygote arrest protein 1-like n=1 Tax=Physella acuta TaxID=109671 RepID=UPI0027DBAB82|nr:zygote arrest protein 1-like [Physella acuta]XP_059172252.1 zygote arrest protein 1-like [Physella acuta]
MFFPCALKYLRRLDVLVSSLNKTQHCLIFVFHTAAGHYIFSSCSSPSHSNSRLDHTITRMSDLNRNNNLKRMYGYFRCTDCKKGWESAQVYSRKGDRGAAYGQECKDCKVMCMPYRIARLTCSQCGLQECACDSDRHVDPNKSHRSDLCGKCRAGYPCQQ